MAEGYLDTIHHVETPEGVILELRPAGPVARLAAWLVDGGLRVLVFLCLSIPLAALGRVGSGLEYLLLFAVSWAYPVTFELLARGSTPGKKLLGLQVVRANGLPVDFAASLLRNLLRAADALPFFFIAALVSMLSTRGFRRLGDLAAGTLVVYRTGGAAAGLWRAAAAADVRPAPSAAALTAVEQKAIVRFSERSPFFGEARSRELASAVAPLVNRAGAAEAGPVAALEAVAAWITGGPRRGA